VFKISISYIYIFKSVQFHFDNFASVKEKTRKEWTTAGRGKKCPTAQANERKGGKLVRRKTRKEENS
jgi:hypothetical protein